MGVAGNIGEPFSLLQVAPPSVLLRSYSLTRSVHRRRRVRVDDHGGYARIRPDALAPGGAAIGAAEKRVIAVIVRSRIQGCGFDGMDRQRPYRPTRQPDGAPGRAAIVAALHAPFPDACIQRGRRGRVDRQCQDPTDRATRRRARFPRRPCFCTRRVRRHSRRPHTAWSAWSGSRPAPYRLTGQPDGAPGEAAIIAFVHPIVRCGVQGRRRGRVDRQLGRHSKPVRSFAGGAPGEAAIIAAIHPAPTTCPRRAMTVSAPGSGRCDATRQARQERFWRRAPGGSLGQ
jgi:hypothetical protein